MRVEGIKIHQMNPRARELRKDMTEAEKWLWEKIRSRELDGFKFRRQRPIGPFVVDFVCLKKRLVIEVDGGQHAGAAARDKKRSEFLTKVGYKVLRFWNHEVLQNGEAVLSVIHDNLIQRDPSPCPFPEAGERRTKRRNLQQPSPRPSPGSGEGE